MFLTVIKWVTGLFTGGALGNILDTIEHHMDDETKKEEIKADVTKTYVQAQANLMVGRTWWFQLFFVIPLGMWWAAVCFDSIWHLGLNVAKLPEPLDDWAAYIISALFLVDGTKAVLGRWKR